VIASVKTKTSVAGMTRSIAYHPEAQHVIAAMKLELEAMRPHLERIADDWSLTRILVSPISTESRNTGSPTNWSAGSNVSGTTFNSSRRSPDPTLPRAPTDFHGSSGTQTTG